MGLPLTYTLNLANSAFLGPARQARGAIGAIRSEAGQATGVIGGMIGKLAGISAVVGGITGVLAGLKSAVKGAAAMEGTEVAFDTLLGSADKARTVLRQLTDLGADTPFEFPELAAAGQKLIAFGESGDAVAETLRRIGDISSGVQAPIGEIAEIYGKARVQQQLFAEDINQLTGRGIPIITELAKVLKQPESGIKKLAEQGLITFPLLDQAFRNLTGEGGKFAGMMVKQSQTMNGMWSTLMDNLSSMSRAVGKPINEHLLKPLLRDALTLALRVGAGVNAAMQVAVAAAKQGRLGDILGMTIQLGLAKAAVAGVSILGRMIVAVTNALGAGLTSLFSGEAVGGLVDVLTGMGIIIRAEFGGAFNDVVSLFQAGLQTAIENAMEILGSIPGLGKMTGLEGFKAGTFDDNLKDRVRGNERDRLKTEGQALINKGLGIDGLNERLAKAMHDVDPGGFLALVRALEGQIKEATKSGLVNGAEAAGLQNAINAANNAAGGKKGKGGKDDSWRDFDRNGNPRQRRASDRFYDENWKRLSDGRKKIFGYSEKGNAERKEAKDKTLLEKAMQERGMKPPKVPTKDMDTPGKATKREREREEARKLANAQKPRWDLVQSIEGTLKGIAVA